MTLLTSSPNVNLGRCCLVLVVLLAPSLFDVRWFGPGGSGGDVGSGGSYLFAQAECFSNQMNRMTRAHLRILRKGGPYSQLADLIRTHNDCLIRDDKLRFKKSFNSIPALDDVSSKELLDSNSLEDEDRRKLQQQQQQPTDETIIKLKLVAQLLRDLARANVPKQSVIGLKEQLNSL